MTRGTYDEGFRAGGKQWKTLYEASDMARDAWKRGYEAAREALTLAARYNGVPHDHKANGTTPETCNYVTCIAKRVIPDADIHSAGSVQPAEGRPTTSELPESPDLVVVAEVRRIIGDHKSLNESSCDAIREALQHTRTDWRGIHNDEGAELLREVVKDGGEWTDADLWNRVTDWDQETAPTTSEVPGSPNLVATDDAGTAIQGFCDQGHPADTLPCPMCLLHEAYELVRLHNRGTTGPYGHRTAAFLDAYEAGSERTIRRDLADLRKGYQEWREHKASIGDVSTDVLGGNRILYSCPFIGCGWTATFGLGTHPEPVERTIEQHFDDGHGLVKRSRDSASPDAESASEDFDAPLSRAKRLLQTARYIIESELGDGWGVVARINAFLGDRPADSNSASQPDGGRADG